MRFGIAVISGLVASGLVLAYGAYGPELRLSLPVARSSDTLCASFTETDAHFPIPHLIRQSRSGMVIDVAYRADDVRRFSE